MSMSRLATPYDNARAESFVKTLKYEEVYRTEYRDLEQAKTLIGEFLESTTSSAAFGTGLSSAGGVRTQLTIVASERTSMSFLRHGEIYRSDIRLNQSWQRQPASSPPVLIGYDEFPAGYSLAGCPSAKPASASPTEDDSQQPSLPYNDFSAEQQ